MAKAAKVATFAPAPGIDAFSPFSFSGHDFRFGSVLVADFDYPKSKPEKKRPTYSSPQPQRVNGNTEGEGEQ